MECKAWTYEELPEYEEIPEGAVVIETSGKEMGTTYLHDVVYAKTPQGDLRLQIIIPECREKAPAPELPFLMDANGNYPPGYFDANPQYPCVIHVQGSAWLPQNLYMKAATIGKLAERGFVVAIVEYRDSTRAIYPTQILDTLNAVRFMKKNAKRYCVDPEKIVVSGDSSGGHTSMMAGIWCKEDKGENLYPDYSAEVCGVISQYASSDFLFEDSNPSTPNHCAANSPEGLVMGGVDLTPEMCEELTVRTHITPECQIPPVLMFHGTKDRIVNCLCSVYMYEKLKACGKDAEFYLMKGADHGGSEYWSKPALDIIERFIRRVTKS